jgi:hypothetical protein
MSRHAEALARTRSIDSIYFFAGFLGVALTGSGAASNK